MNCGSGMTVRGGRRRKGVSGVRCASLAFSTRRLNCAAWRRGAPKALRSLLPMPRRFSMAKVSGHKATVDTFSDPLGFNLGQVRILRTSPSTPVPDICPPKE